MLVPQCPIRPHCNALILHTAQLGAAYQIYYYYYYYYYYEVDICNQWPNVNVYYRHIIADNNGSGVDNSTL